MSTACATGVHSIGSAFHRIRYGRSTVDRVYRLITVGSVRRAICGSTEAAVTPLGIHAFARYSIYERSDRKAVLKNESSRKRK